MRVAIGALFALTGCAAAAKGAPDFVLVSMDTLRADRLGAYGNADGLTPNLDRFASEGVVFTHAYSQATATQASHGSVFTSRYPSENDTRGHAAKGVPYPTLAEVLKTYGYRTAAFVGGGDLRPEMGLVAGFETYRCSVDFGSLWHTAPEALKWLDATGHADPTFLFVHGYDAHARYLKPAPYGFLHADLDAQGPGANAVRTETERLVDGRLYRSVSVLDGLLRTTLRPRSPEARATLPETGGPSLPTGDADVALVRGAYDGAVAYGDAMFGLLMAGLQERGVLDRAVVIVMGDHGEQLGEDGIFHHCCGGGDEETHVPLMVRMPGAAGGGRRVDALVGLVDILPTVLELAGAAAPSGIHGLSLAPALRGEQFHGHPAIFTQGAFFLRLSTARDATGWLGYWGPPAGTAFLPDLVESAALDGPAFVASPGADKAALRDALVAFMRSLAPGPGARPVETSPELEKSLKEHGYFDAGDR